MFISYEQQRAKENREMNGIALGIIAVVIIFLIIFGVVFYYCLSAHSSNSEQAEHSCSWVVQNVDDQEITFCKECGKQKSSSEHSHSWKAHRP